MRRKIAALLVIAGACIYPAFALTLDGSVEKTDVLKKANIFARIFGFAREPEGRIGVRISTAGRIGYVHPGSPADKAGLQKDDVVLIVDGKKHAIDDISGEPGTKVHLEVRRQSDQFAVDVSRIDYHDIVR